MKIPAAGPWLSMLITALLLTSCAPGPRLESRPATTVVPDTSYTLILHGCNFGNDLATIAFLRREDQPYLFQPHSPEFQYRIQENLAADEALARARTFVDCSPHFSHARLRSLSGPDGDVIGYEMRPIYLAHSFRWPDMLNVFYHFKGGKVLIYVNPIPHEDDLDDDV
ncbi:MAG: hypothetical protein ACNA74_08575 [Desulfurivibrio sp.]